MLIMGTQVSNKLTHDQFSSFKLTAGHVQLTVPQVKIHDPATSDLLILAHGLGLHRIIRTLMQIYDSKQSLILLLNPSLDEETDIGIMGCRQPGL
jgi:hypothetical protein